MNNQASVVPTELRNAKVAMVVATPYPNGLADARGVSESLNRAGVRTHVLCLSRAERNSEGQAGICVHELQPHVRDVLSRARFAWRVARRLRSIAPDIVHVYEFRLCALIPTLAPRPKYVYDLRSGNVSGKRRARFADSVSGLESRRFDRRIVISERVGSYVCKRSFKGSPEVPVGYDAELAAEARSLRLDNGRDKARVPTVIYVGKLHIQRRVDRLIEMASILKAKGVQFKLSLVGDGTDRENLQAMTRNRGLESLVDFSGAIPSQAVWREYGTADVALAYVPMVAHYQFQPPLKTVEAMACGLAVVATDTAGNRDFVRHESNGILTSDCAESLADAVERLLASPGLRERIGRQAESDVEQFSWDRIVADRVMPIYSTLK